MQIVVILRVSRLSSFISHASGSLDIIFHASGLVAPPAPLPPSINKYGSKRSFEEFVSVLQSKGSEFIA
jgi:hypothetical protein